jgi:HK97 family phage prohead protease
MTDIEIRTATQLLDVRHPERIIDLIAVPYDEEARVVHQGRLIVETIAPGAFAGVSSPVKVRRVHNPEQPLGRVVKFHPNDPRGLRTELRVVNTPAGDEVLELAADDLLSASVGMYPLPGGEQYTSNRSRRRITRAVLDHIGLTGDPAYVGAKVLAVRANVDERPARLETPNLDRIRLERLATAAGMGDAVRDIVTPVA